MLQCLESADWNAELDPAFGILNGLIMHRLHDAHGLRCERPAWLRQ